MTDLQALTTHYISQGQIIIGGDFNAQITIDKSLANPKSIRCSQFAVENNLIAVNTTGKRIGPNYSFIPTRSMIDHFLVDQTLVHDVQAFTVLEENEQFIQMSDHLPLLAKLCTRQNIEINFEHNEQSIAWNKLSDDHLTMYQYSLDQSLNSVSMHECTVDSLSDGIRHAIHHAANTVLPKSTFNKHTKPYWTSEVKNAHSKSRQMRATWIANGRPRGRENIYFRNYKEAKWKFRKIQRIESEKVYGQSVL